MGTVNLQPAVYTMRETSQPAPIAAAWTGYRVPEASRVAMKGVRFSVKLACARWAVTRILVSLPFCVSVTVGDRAGLAAVELVRGRALLRLLGRRVRVGVADALYAREQEMSADIAPACSSAHGGAVGRERKPVG